MKHLILSLITILCLTSSFSQTDQREVFSRNSFWTETVINGVIKNKWRWQLDYQYRRTSDPSDVVGSGNMFKNYFQHVYRPWVHYQMNDNVRFSLSPIGFWESYTSALEGGGTKKIQPEFRICPQLTLTNKIGRITIDQRYRYEFRIFGTKVDNLQGGEFGYSQGMEFHDTGRKLRMRYFVRAIVPLNHKTLEPNTFYLATWNEIFIAMGKNTNNDKIWDQNRSFFMLGYKPAMNFPMRFELGYGCVYANKFTSSYTNGQYIQTGHKIERNNILQVYVIFENFNKAFGSKKQPVK